MLEKTNVDIGLSIIIPVHNRQDLVVSALDSIDSIKGISIEVIVVDDASTDATFECLKNQKNNKSFDLRVFRNQDTRGAPYCRNFGVNTSCKPFVFFLDSDDVVRAEVIRKAIEELNDNPKIDLIYGYVSKVSSDLTERKKIEIGRFFDGRSRNIASYSWHTSGAIYRKTFIDRLGGWNEKLVGSQDWEYQARAKVLTEDLMFYEDSFALWRDHDKNRIGRKTYARSYVNSVADASTAIWGCACKRKKDSYILALRLILKLIVHALEAGAHDDYETKKTILRKYVCKINDSIFIRTIVAFLLFKSAKIDMAVLKMQKYVHR